MLKNAYLYEETIKEMMMEVWYDEKYQYYFMGSYHDVHRMSEDGDWNQRQFASVNHKGKVIGLISYSIQHETRRATTFGAINFTDDIATFGYDMYQAIDDIFCKFNLNSMDFCVVCGNPAEKSYDRMIEMFGGRIVGVYNQNAVDMKGNLCDSKMYEIMREDYLAAKERRRNGKNK